MHFMFCQISTNLINAELPDDIAAEYYRKQWEKPGYWRSEHFWEIPLWIAEICGSLRHTELDYTTELCIITEHNQRLPDGDYYLFSVLDVNKAIIRDIINNNPEKYFILGGYIKDHTFFLGKTIKPCGCCDIAVSWYFSVKSFISKFGCYVYDLDYSLFAGMQTIPRLTMSTGCKHHCKFCTVPNELTTLSVCDIRKQIKSFECLDFRYIYLNDKTFTQADNYMLLQTCYDTIKEYNPKFIGFIVQTTCAQIIKPGIVRQLRLLGVEIVELGVETYNDRLLKGLKKPQNTKIIRQAIIELYFNGIKIIPNIIIGIDGENHSSYSNTLDFLAANSERLFALNIYNLVSYNDTNSDKNELKVSNTPANKWFYKKIFNLGLKILKQ